MSISTWHLNLRQIYVGSPGVFDSAVRRLNAFIRRKMYLQGYKESITSATHTAPLRAKPIDNDAWWPITPALAHSHSSALVVWSSFMMLGLTPLKTAALSCFCIHHAGLLATGISLSCATAGWNPCSALPFMLPYPHFVFRPWELYICRSSHCLNSLYVWYKEKRNENVW